jgi:hypothetical protein
MGFNPFKWVKKTVKKAVKIVTDFVSWLIPQPDIPDYGDSELDDFEKGILLNKQSNDASIPVIYGTRMIGGTRCFIESSGTDNASLYMALVMCEGEINDITSIIIDDKTVTWSGDLADNTQVTVNTSDGNFYKDSASLITVEPHYGTDGQSASSLLSTLSSWGSLHKLSGLAYLALKFTWNQDAFRGVPKVQAIVQGKKVVAYNSSSVAQTAAYSDNPAWCLLDYLTNARYGKGLAIGDINVPSFYTAAGVCDTDVTAYGSTTIDILDCNAVIDTSKKVMENVRELLSGCRGYLTFTGGVYKLLVETTGSASITLTEDDIIGGYNLSSEDKNNKYNRVIISFVNPDRNWQVDEVQWPEIDDSGYSSADQHATMKTADGGFLLEGRFSMKTITSPYQALEMAEVILRRSREALTLEINCGGNAYDLAIGDIVAITHSSIGFSAKDMRVVGITFNEDYTIGLTLVEYQAAHYTWATKTQVASTPSTTLPNPFTTIDLSEVTDFLIISDTIVTYNDGVIITKLLIDVLPLDLLEIDAFYDYFEVEISEDGLTYSEVGMGKQTRFEVLNVKDDTQYFVRVRYINTMGVRSDYITQTHTVVGQSAPPSNVENFSINVVGDQAVLSWDAVTDLDLAYYVIKHNPNTTGATFINSKNVINKIARPATTATVPFQKGTYLIKAEDKRGNQSIIETLIVSSIDISNYVLETTINEHTAFSGSKTNAEVVVKNSVNHIGLTATGTLGNSSSSVPSTGIYEFSNTITLPAIFKAKFESNVQQIVENVAEYIDGGRPSSSTNIDSGTPDPFDGKTVQNCNSILQISTSDDNITFSSFQSFTTGEFKGRYFKFRVLLTSADQDSRTLIENLTVTASLKEKLESGADLASGTGGLAVTYSNAFRLNPSIIISGQNMTTGDYFTISGKSTTGFTIEFFNSSATSINRTFDYQAKGTG